MNQFLKRLTLETPKFFKKIVTLGITAGSVGTGVVLIPNTPPIIHEIAGHLIWIGLTAAIIAKSTTTKPEQI